MEMTMKEIKEMYKEDGYCDIEVYAPNSYGTHYPNHFHTDNCEATDDYDDSTLIGLWGLMDEDDYNNTICANGCVSADFTEWYGDKDAKVLVCMLANR